MHLSPVVFCSLILIFNIHQTRTSSIYRGMTDTDLNIMKMLLESMENSISEQTIAEAAALSGQDDVENLSLEDALTNGQTQEGMDEAQIRELLSAKNLKNVRNDSSRRSSGCFGRRMDRIGSMSSLGCNTAGRYSNKSR
uniref:B-type natriuretic peptide n=1 Tax=Gouania willdenowi TaxID=441366 RepID=A0A8C5E1J6_GOUWI